MKNNLAKISQIPKGNKQLEKNLKLKELTVIPGTYSMCFNQDEREQETEERSMRSLGLTMHAGSYVSWLT